ncbi:ROK family protein [Ancylobacter sp. 6x-1]|uniref:ROK family protein n=1 Tax=Ancylobacter crimeensis TaxID=2579147 RepID=A0ABT0DEC9_9HYPH|nr:ROK family protein [Ancylobacter crimeensis]MCK0198342.1 ROK family protein [Ancylobacter crimeensis]
MAKTRRKQSESDIVVLERTGDGRQMSKSRTAQQASVAPLAGHGSTRLPAVEVDGYNSQLRDEEGFVGDKARRAAFFEGLDTWRELAARKGKDLFDDTPTSELSKRSLDKTFLEGNVRGQAVMLSAIEDYAQQLATVARRLLRTKEWRDTQRIAVGGGLRASRFAEIAIARTELLLRQAGTEIELAPIRHDPDEAGLIGAVHLAPSWMFGGHDSIVAVDIGGSNIRAGIVELNAKKKPDLSAVAVNASELWRHADEEVDRAAAIERLVDMLNGLIAGAEKSGMQLAPFIGIGCPGAIAPDGSIEEGAQNLPGNWSSSRFNLPEALREAIPAIRGDETVVVMHNDAVVQGLSQRPFMADVEGWGVLTIGTGLGNAHFTNRGKLES